MNLWWTKFGEIFRSRPPQVVEEEIGAADEVPTKPSAIDLQAATPAPSQASSVPTEACATALPFEQWSVVDARLASLSAGVSRLAEAIGRMEDKNQDILRAIERLNSSAASLPALATDAARLLGDVEDRLETLEQRTGQGCASLTQTAREVSEVKGSMAGLEESQEQCRQACIQLAQQQEQVAEVFSGLRELTSRSVELAKISAAAIRDIADDRSKQIEDLRQHVSEEGRRVAIRATIASLLAALAAVAAATAAVISALHQP